jgi:membrane dipeptidase
MINVSSMFVDGAEADAYRARIAALRPRHDALQARFEHDAAGFAREWGLLLDGVKPAKATWRKAVDAIEHAMRAAGPDAVGLGTDFDGIPDPEGLEDVSKLPRITEELLRRGHSDAEVRGVLGESFLRFFSRVEDVSHSLAGEAPSTASLEKPSSP